MEADFAALAGLLGTVLLSLSESERTKALPVDAAEVLPQARAVLDVSGRSFTVLEIPGRLVRPEDWHLTLRFLGETSPEALETLRKTLGAPDLGVRTEIVFGRLGAFPSPDRSAVLWLGVGEGAADLATIQSRVEAAARRAGFPAGTLPFTPHVTLGRPEPPVDVRGLIDRMSALQQRMAVDAVVSFRRRLGSRHGRYEEVARYPLRDPD